MIETNELRGLHSPTQPRRNKAGFTVAEAIKAMQTLRSILAGDLGGRLARLPRHKILAYRVLETQSRIALESRRHGPGWCG